MIIQIGHSRNSDFITELYLPLKEATFFSEYTWIFPHDGKKINSHESLKEVDLFIVEVSHPSTGLGIEIGFANMYGKGILCISKKGVKVSNSLKYVTDNFLEYQNPDDMIEKIHTFLKNF